VRGGNNGRDALGGGQHRKLSKRSKIKKCGDQGERQGSKRKKGGPGKEKEVYVSKGDSITISKKKPQS